MVGCGISRTPFQVLLCCGHCGSSHSMRTILCAHSHRYLASSISITHHTARPPRHSGSPFLCPLLAHPDSPHLFSTTTTAKHGITSRCRLPLRGWCLCVIVNSLYHRAQSTTRLLSVVNVYMTIDPKGVYFPDSALTVCLPTLSP